MLISDVIRGQSTCCTVFWHFDEGPCSKYIYFIPVHDLIKQPLQYAYIRLCWCVRYAHIHECIYATVLYKLVFYLSIYYVCIYLKYHTEGHFTCIPNTKMPIGVCFWWMTRDKCLWDWRILFETHNNNHSLFKNYAISKLIRITKLALGSHIIGPASKHPCKIRVSNPHESWKDNTKQTNSQQNVCWCLGTIYYAFNSYIQLAGNNSYWHPTNIWGWNCCSLRSMDCSIAFCVTCI